MTYSNQNIKWKKRGCNFDLEKTSSFISARKHSQDAYEMLLKKYNIKKCGHCQDCDTCETLQYNLEEMNKIICKKFEICPDIFENNQLWKEVYEAENKK